MTELRPTIDVALVERLLAAQFPQYAKLPVRPVEFDGNDNRTFRIGDALTARLPSATGYEVQVLQEAAFMPSIAAGVSLPVPEVVAVGEPGEGYPFRWSLRRWIDGELLRGSAVDVAADLAGFLNELGGLDTALAPVPGPATFGRGAPVRQWQYDIDERLERYAGRLDVAGIRAEWAAACATTWERAPRWFHGDVANTNLLVRDGRLSAVLDFGCAGAGDPACDLVIAWSDFDEEQRGVFRDAIRADDALWSRGRGWALWRGLIGVDDGRWDAPARRILAALGYAIE